MKRPIRSVCLLAAILVFVSLVATGQNKGQSKKSDLDLLVKSAHFLEADPLGKDAKKMREWSILFVIQAPDISVQICTDYLAPLLGSKKNYESELIGQEMISMAAFIVEHPDQASDKIAVHQAGIEGVLKAYESILKTKPKSKIDFLDELISKRDKGELKAYVENIASTKCKPKS